MLASSSSNKLDPTNILTIWKHISTRVTLSMSSLPHEVFDNLLLYAKYRLNNSIQILHSRMKSLNLTLLFQIHYLLSSRRYNSSGQVGLVLHKQVHPPLQGTIQYEHSLFKQSSTLCTTRKYPPWISSRNRQDACSDTN